MRKRMGLAVSGMLRFTFFVFGFFFLRLAIFAVPRYHVRDHCGLEPALSSGLMQHSLRANVIRILLRRRRR
ncbi:MAG: hypothetical protein JSV16_10185, partial [Candidatus Hydrogenedentota bacterium]